MLLEVQKSFFTINHSKFIDSFSSFEAIIHSVVTSESIFLEFFQARLMFVCHIRAQAFRLTSVELDRITAFLKRICFDGSQAKALFDIPETHLD